MSATPMTPAEFAAAMRKISDSADIERAHGDADTLMCNMLRDLGYADGVEVFAEMDKWYA